MLSSGLPVWMFEGVHVGSSLTHSMHSLLSTLTLEIPEQQSTNCATNFCINYKLQQPQPKRFSNATLLFVRMWWVNRAMWTITWTLTADPKHQRSSGAHGSTHSAPTSSLTAIPIHRFPPPLSPLSPILFRCTLLFIRLSCGPSLG